VILAQRASGDVDHRKDEQQRKGAHQQYRSDVVHPFTDAEPEDRDHDQAADERAGDGADVDMVAGQGLRSRANGVDQGVRHAESKSAEEHDGVEPEVPADEERDAAIESDFGPLI
jgi:hypothetical protein